MKNKDKDMPVDKHLSFFLPMFDEQIRILFIRYVFFLLSNC